MANRWPHLLQTTVSIRIAVEGCSASPRRRLATPFGFTSADSTLTGLAIAASPAIAESAPLSLRPGLVHSECPTAQILPVQSCHRFFGFFVARHRNKAKAAGASGIAIGRDGGALDAAMRLKQRTEFGFCHAEREIPDINLLHFGSFCCAVRFGCSQQK